MILVVVGVGFWVEIRLWAVFDLIGFWVLIVFDQIGFWVLDVGCA